MADRPYPDWDPKSPAVLSDQRAAYDELRERCPLAYSEFLQWSLFRHEDVCRVLHDHESFSNAVSRHLSVPSGMDPPEHTPYRRIIERYFSAPRMQAFEPGCRAIATALVQDALRRGEVELMADLALPFAVRVQCAFLGWPPALHEPLLRWTGRNYDATLAEDREAMAGIAVEFQAYIDAMLEARRQAGAGPDADITASLMHEQVEGRPLSHAEIASILRNWTVGEIGTISASVGILAHYLAQRPELQQQLRDAPALLPAAIDEILRIDGPLLVNRRVATRTARAAGREFAAGERLSVMWTAANRDGRVFDDPDSFRLDRDPAQNLLYGAGIHVCPGAPLARMELRLVLQALLAHTAAIEPVAGRPAMHAVYPAGGYRSVPLRLHARPPAAADPR
jgi:cytochrome P450